MACPNLTTPSLLVHEMTSLNHLYLETSRSALLTQNATLLLSKC